MKTDDAPLAVTSTGLVLLNVTHIFGRDEPRQLLARVPASATVFVGVVLDADRIDVVLERLGHGAREAAAFEAGHLLRSWRRINGA